MLRVLTLSLIFRIPERCFNHNKSEEGSDGRRT